MTKPGAIGRDTPAGRSARFARAQLTALVCLAFAGTALAQAPRPGAAAPTAVGADQMVQLDFDDVELSVVIDTVAKLTQKNFLYDDRVRGRVTIISHQPIPLELAYAVFESALQMKGFTTVEGPGGAIRIIPIRDAKESSIETSRSDRAPPFRDRFITRLIPLQYIDAESITNTLKPLVSKDAAMFAYAPTNSIILTDSASNIRRILDILDLIDVETYKEQQALFKIRYADASSMARMLNEVYGQDVPSVRTVATRARSRRTTPATPTPASPAAGDRGRIKIITDQRTNSLIVLASRTRIADIRRLIGRLDVPIEGGGRIHVHYLKNADAEELAQTLNALITGQPSAPGGGAAGAPAQALRAAVTELAEGISLTADPATNSLVIRASAEGYATLAQVIEQLDIARPQVLVEALIMEVDVTEMEDLGISWVLQLAHGNSRLRLETRTADGDALFTGSGGHRSDGTTTEIPFDPDTGLDFANPILVPETSFEALISAAASDSGTNILSAPHVLTSDNEEAEIKIGENIPIITSRVEAATGAPALSTSQNIERQDVGVTLRVTPQISEGDTLRLQIFQEITQVAEGQALEVVSQIGPTLLSRKIENTVVVNDGQTVVIGGLISDVFQDGVSKVPWLGDIPFLGWLFKSTSMRLRKVNLVVFLTPHIIRGADDLERITIRKREEFRRESRQVAELEDEGRSTNPVRASLDDLSERYPVERLDELAEKREELERLSAEAAELAASGPRYAVLVGVFEDGDRAANTLTELLDAGYDGTLVSSRVDRLTLFELRLGPYDELSSAEDVATIMRSAYDFRPSIVVARPEDL